MIGVSWINEELHIGRYFDLNERALEPTVCLGNQSTNSAGTEGFFHGVRLRNITSDTVGYWNNSFDNYEMQFLSVCDKYFCEKVDCFGY